MKTAFYTALFFLLACSSSSQRKESSSPKGKQSFYDNMKEINFFKMDCSIRAIETIDENTCYFAGSNGMYGFTKDGGNSWTIDSLSHPSHASLQFRSIAKTEKAWMILGIASPALLYRSEDEGQNWEIVYQENDTLAFYDSMAFWNDMEGIAMGDPTDGCLSVIKTKDGGMTWNKIDCEGLPASAKGEAAFAASNSNIALAGSHVWMVSGGVKSRVYHSADRGATWEVFDTPIIQGQQMTGIFSCDFLNEKEGYIFGGNWEKPKDYSANKAFTQDGGRTWTLVSDSLSPGYRSCVQYLDNSGTILAVGFPGISISTDFGRSWENVSEESFYTARATENVLWLAGKERIGRLVLK